MKAIVWGLAIAAAFTVWAPASEADATARCAYAAGKQTDELYQNTFEVAEQRGLATTCRGDGVQNACLAALAGCAEKLAAQGGGDAHVCERVFAEVRPIRFASWEQCPGGPLNFDAAASGALQ